MKPPTRPQMPTDESRVFLLNEDDTIQPGDFARPLDLLYVGQSDYLHTENTYSGKPINHTRWATVEQLGWGSHIVGRMTVAEYNEWCDSLEKPHQPSSRYEFCRGPLPAYKRLAEHLPEEEAVADWRAARSPADSDEWQDAYEYGTSDPTEAGAHLGGFGWGDE